MPVIERYERSLSDAAPDDGSAIRKTRTCADARREVAPNRIRRDQSRVVHGRADCSEATRRRRAA
jgi:hypothetical protein